MEKIYKIFAALSNKITSITHIFGLLAIGIGGALLVYDLRYLLSFGGGWDYINNIIVEAHGLFFDLLVLGVLISIYERRRQKKEAIEREENLIDDFRGWDEKEAMYRIKGAYQRLKKLGVSNINLNDCYLSKATLCGKDLTNSRLVRSNLTGSNLLFAKLIRADLSNANLTEAFLDGADLTESDLSGANLNKVHSWGVNFTKSNLSKAELFEAELINANLSEATLEWCNLTNANLTNANLHGADLSRAKLIGANLSGANLNGAIISGTSISIDLSSFIFSQTDQTPNNISFSKNNEVVLHSDSEPINPLLIIKSTDLSGINLSGAFVGMNWFKYLDAIRPIGYNKIIETYEIDDDGRLINKS